MARNGHPSRAKFAGYVTTLASITGKTPSEVEKSLGYAPGSLGEGYLVYALVDDVGDREFHWKDRTTYSGGWHYDRTIDEYVQRDAELRAYYGKLNNYDETATDAKLAEVMKPHVEQLNVRSGPKRIVKVRPKGKVASYPDSPLRNVPQWELRVAKEFTLLADVAPNHRFL